MKLGKSVKSGKTILMNHLSGLFLHLIYYLLAKPTLIVMPFKFEKLVVWQKALDLTGLVHEVSKKFPKDELFILSAQIKRAASSVCLNIAEGATALSNAEFARFLQIALRSDMEVVSCTFIAQKRSIISEDDFADIYRRCEEILAMINGLRKSLL